MRCTREMLRSVTRSILDALDRPLFASQQPILTAQQFCRASEDRGVTIDEGALEVLHRAAILVPAFALVYEPARVRAAFPDTETLAIRRFLDWVPTEGEELRERRHAGLLVDGASVPWAPYRLHRGTYAGHAYERHRYLYSPYQLLQLRNLQNFTSAIKWVGSTGRRRLSTNQLALRQAQNLGERLRTDLPVLHAIETIYRPDVMENIRGSPMAATSDAFDPWRTLRRSFEPTELLAWTERTPDELLALAEGLLTAGWWNDPLRGWDELVAQVRPQQWLKLRGNALITIDHKIAAEQVLRFYEDLVDVGAAPPMPPLGMTRAPRHSRLSRDRAGLQEVLTRFDLSPYPSLVLVIEGATEAAIMPRVLDELSSSWQPYIELLNAEGAARALDPLMAYAAQPRVLRQAQAGLLVRPPVRVLVVMDAEGRFVTAADRKRQKELWLDRILRSLPAPYQTPKAKSQMQDLVAVVTWNRAGESFEFAHWTDRQIAAAVLAQGGSPNIPLEQFTRSVAGVRRRRANLESLWHTGWSRAPRKPAIALTLWPSLARRVTTDRSREYARIPALRVARLAIDMARRSPRHMVHILEP